MKSRNIVRAPQPLIIHIVKVSEGDTRWDAVDCMCVCSQIKQMEEIICLKII